MSLLETGSGHKTGASDDDSQPNPSDEASNKDEDAQLGSEHEGSCDDSLQVATIGGIEEDNVVDVPASSTIVEGNKLESSTVTVNNAPVTNIINNFQQVQNPPVADQHVPELMQDNPGNQGGVLAGGVDIQCRWFTLQLHGFPATVFVCGAVGGAFGLSLYTISSITQIVEVVAPLATQVILKVVSGSLFIHILTKDKKAKQVLLDDLTSNRLLKVVQDIAAGENLTVERISLVGVAAVVITKQEFKKLKKNSKKKLKRLRSLNGDSIQAITNLPSVLQNQSRVLSVRIPPENEKEYIACLKRNEEFWKGAKSKMLKRRHSCPKFKETEKADRTDISSKFMRRSSIQIDSSPQLQRDSSTSLPQSIQKAEESKFSKMGFLRNHPKFSEFQQVAMRHPELQKWIAAHLKDLKNTIWIGSKQSIVVQIKNLSKSPTKYFAGDFEEVLRDALRVYTSLRVRFKSDYFYHLLSFMLNLMASWTDVSLNRIFVKFYCFGLTKLLHYETYHFANNLNLSRLVYTVLSMTRDYQKRHPSILLQAYSTYFQKISDDEVWGRDLLWADPQGVLDLVLKIASSSEDNSTKILTNECRQLIKQPAVTLNLKSVDKALEVVKVMREKSKFGLSLQMARWCGSLIADLANGESDSRFPATLFSRSKRRIPFKRSSRTMSMKAKASVSSEINQLLCCFHHLLRIQQRVVRSLYRRYGTIEWFQMRYVYYNISRHLERCKDMRERFPPDPFIPSLVKENVDELKKLLFNFHFTLERCISELQSEVKASGSALEALAEEIFQARLAGSRLLALLLEVSRLLDMLNTPGLDLRLPFFSRPSFLSKTDSVYKTPSNPTWW